MTLLKSSIESLRARVHHLTGDFKWWLQRTTVNGELRQHHSQVRRITDTLSGTLKESLSGTPINLEAFPPGNANLGDLPKLRRAVGSVQLLWEFFRDKFAQRDVDLFEHHLGAADDLAWSCFEPCLEIFTKVHDFMGAAVSSDSVKEPPLIFYTTDRTPFAQARTKTFHPLGLDAKDQAQFAAVLMGLPVPVVGVPWAAANMLPYLVLVGHEVGHVVAEDLGLAGEARDVLTEVDYPNDVGNARKKVWQSWSDEVFADVFGVFAMGRGFVSALAEELAADLDEVHGATIDKQKPGKYPTPTLRMAICEAVLRLVGVMPSKAWSDAYGDLIGPSREFRNDINLVAAAFTDQPWTAFGGKKFDDVLPWNADEEAAAEAVARAALSETIPIVPFSVRHWVAASKLASQSDAAAYTRLSLDQKLAEFIVGRRGDVVRSERASVLRGQLAPPSLDVCGAPPSDDIEALRIADESAGIRIANILKL